MHDINVDDTNDCTCIVNHEIFTSILFSQAGQIAKLIAQKLQIAKFIAQKLQL
jgi:hypothetical protein